MNRSEHLVVPLFKGMVNEPDEVYEGLLTGRNASGKVLSETGVFRLLAQCPSVALVQDVRRALFAMAHAVHHSKEQGTTSQLYSPEGCLHRVGTKVMRGAQLFGEIWRGDLVPSEVRFRVPDPFLTYISDCTSREVDCVLAQLDEERGAADVITDVYHVDRARKIFDRRKAPGQNVGVAAPSAYTHLLKSPHLPERFRELLHVGHNTVERRLEQEGALAKEARHEVAYWLLGQLGRRVEERLAQWLRSDERVLKSLFPQGVPEEALKGVPPRS
jgi:hypothetical protein